jgi:hypothetical protein
MFDKIILIIFINLTITYVRPSILSSLSNPLSTIIRNSSPLNRAKHLHTGGKVQKSSSSIIQRREIDKELSARPILPFPPVELEHNYYEKVPSIE